jgi:hypothetical protein
MGFFMVGHQGRRLPVRTDNRVGSPAVLHQTRYRDGFDGSYRAGTLATAAADTGGDVRNGEHQVLLVRLHIDGMGGANFSTGPTGCPLGNDYAAAGFEADLAQLDMLLFL